jgi:hypothetical protein
MYMDIDMDMQHGHGHAGWTWTCSMDTQYGFGHAAWIWTMDMHGCWNADKKLGIILDRIPLFALFKNYSNFIVVRHR